MIQNYSIKNPLALFSEIKQIIEYMVPTIQKESRNDIKLFQIQRKLDAAIGMNFCDLPKITLDRIFSYFQNNALSVQLCNKSLFENFVDNQIEEITFAFNSD